MTEVNWKAGINGLWSAASDWDDDVVPNNSDDQVYLPTYAGDYTVSASGTFTIGQLEVESGATLAIKAGVFTVGAAAGQGDVYDGGAITVATGATLELTGNYAEINGPGTLTLSGVLAIDALSFPGLFGGVITMVHGQILGSTTANINLLNVDDTISGSGTIGNTASVSTGGSDDDNSPGLDLENSKRCDD